MFNDDDAYFRQRAESELDHARQASSEQVVKIHQQFAKAYLDRAASIREETPADREAG